MNLSILINCHFVNWFFNMFNFLFYVPTFLVSICASESDFYPLHLDDIICEQPLNMCCCLTYRINTTDQHCVKLHLVYFYLLPTIESLFALTTWQFLVQKKRDPKNCLLSFHYPPQHQLCLHRRNSNIICLNRSSFLQSLPSCKLQ